MAPAVMGTSPSPSVSAPAVVTTGAAVHVDVLARVITQPLHGGDGTYRVEVALHPVDLGAVQAVVSLRGTDLQVVLTPQTRQGHELLSRDAESLRGALSRDGMAVHVTVRDPSQRGAGGQREFTETRGRARFSPVREVAVVDGARDVGGGQIHLLL